MSLHRDFAHIHIPLEDILLATNNFDDKNLIRQGGFGKVYKGLLLLSEQSIDIVAKRLDPSNGHGDEQFWMDISMLFSLKHTNLVSIIGFCDENGEKIIIIKREIHGSLDNYLSDPSLTWMQRLRICVGVARALSYIHYDEGRDFSLIHRNIKSSKILLDDNWEPKLSGFGLSMTNKASERHQFFVTDIICGTERYIDPTYVDTGRVSHRSDMYSFGVVLFEVLCGRDAFITDKDNRDLVQLAKLHYEESKLDDMIDPDLHKQMDPESFNIFSETAYNCLKDEQSERPNIDEIVVTLEKALELQLKNVNLEHSIVAAEVKGASSSRQNTKYVENFKHLKIPFSEIEIATEKFPPDNYIGSGGYGMVYKAELDHFDSTNPSSIEGTNKGDLPTKRSTVAVKRIFCRTDNQGEETFFQEIETLARCKHPNIVSLIGFCNEGDEKILLYEYAANGSLDEYLSSGNRMVNFTWDKRIQMCIQIALGLNYLHTCMEDTQRIIHRDIRSANILLDQNWNPKIADFGLSKSKLSNKKANAFNSYASTLGSSHNTHNTDFVTRNSGTLYTPSHNSSTFNTLNIAGTEAYLDPEYMQTGKLKKESDIYSFGVLLFEVLCGRLAYDKIYYAGNDKGLASIARKCFNEGRLKEIVDPRIKEVDGNKLKQNRAFHQDSLDTFSKIAYQCVAETQAMRPTMEVVIKELENALHLLTNGEFAHLQIPLEKIVSATNNFDAENLIESGFGEAYKGRILRAEELIDIIAWRLDGTKVKDVEFWTEISMLSSLEHKNLVSIAGFCFENREKIVIYEHAVHGSLDQHLSNPTLTWFQRLQICLGAARALSYIHYDVIHCDVKSSKIFLDKDWEAKVFGFELSTKYPESWMHRLLFSQKFKSSEYTDPEYLGTRSVTPKYDVYSFGVILFEVLCGRKAMIGDGGVDQSLTEAAIRLYKEEKLIEMIDPNLRKDMDTKSLTIFSKTAYNCLKERAHRPTMDQVVREIEDALELQWKYENLGQSTFGDEAIKSSNNLKKDQLERLKIPLSKIQTATDNFNDTYLVGSGGFGDVYKAELGLLDDIQSLTLVEGKIKDGMSKRTVAIKRMANTRDEQSKQGFHMEIELLTSCKHPNIVSLLGYSREDPEMILVYEYAFKGSLGDYLAGGTGKSTTLTWVQRIHICLDVARGLNYLHTNMEGKPRIIHRDIKSDNILLDEELNAKVADFGLSRFHPMNQQASTIHAKSVAGTEVYTDPEYLSTFRYKKESDVYSFGVVLFEMLSGSLAYDPIYTRENVKGLAPIARRRFIEGTLKELIDPKIIEEDEKDLFTLNRGPNQDSFDAFSKIAYRCLAETQAKRPTMEDVIKELHNVLSLQGETTVLSRFQLSDIVVATTNFSEACSIGSDAYGSVYKAKLNHFDSSLAIQGENNGEHPKRPINVAIKRISSGEDGQGQQEFLEEIEMLTSYKHPNIVSLLGFCDKGGEMILIFEHAANGSLDNYLISIHTNLTWAQRLCKCLDIARGLNHLHTKMDDERMIIHGDIKSANILLGKHLEAKIAYFGLSKSHRANQEASTLITKNNASTKVYWDPEYEKTGNLKKESDIYSFGVVLFEIFCGRLAYDPIYIGENDNGLAPIARQYVSDGTIQKMIDPKLKVETDEDIFTSNNGPNQDSLGAFLKIANQCLGETQAERPTMKIVIQELEIALNFQENLMNNLQMSLEDIESATEKFSQKNWVRSGRYWKAYKGELPQAKYKMDANANELTTVVAKRFDSKFGQGDLQFLRELEILFRYKNKHIIGLAGYCNEINEKIIVIEHASKGSLDKYLNDATLSWMNRLKICIDVASGLEFLHGGAVMLRKVVHRDIKSASILLNGDWKAKISNLEMSATYPLHHETEYVSDNVYGAFGYLDPEHEEGFLTEKSDIYSFGVILFEILCGRLAWAEGCENYTQSLGPVAKRHYYEKGNLHEMVFEGIKERIVPQSLATFVTIAYQCLHDDRDERPQASEVVTQLKNALEFQEDSEIWEPKLPRNYKDIIKMADNLDIYSIEKKKDLYKKLSDGIFLQKGKWWFSLSSTGKGNTLISATSFSYENLRSHKWRTIQKSIARFHTVAKMMEISNLKIRIKLNTNFLSSDIGYGVHLVFKFCDPRNFLSKHMYVNLRYKMGSETLHAYFATRRDDGWMMIELCRVLNHNQEDTNFEVLLESFSRYYCGCGAIYVQGIKFQAIDNMKHEINKSKGVQQLPNELNGKKNLMLSAKEVLYNSTKMKPFHLKHSAESRFQYVMELLPQQVFRIKYKIEIEKLSPFTEYVCYLVFKLSEKCHGLHCPVKVRDLLRRKNKETKTLYFRTPSPLNQHKDNWVPEQRKDGWMEVMVWKLV